MYFNPRTHTGCDNIYKTADVTRWRFQSTHPHGVRLSLPIFTSKVSFISIHAPTRGATWLSEMKNMAMQISIHAPTRGATSDCLQSLRICQNFNPRTHTGCDGRHYERINAAVKKISIHAPTRGATKILAAAFTQCYNFNPRTHTGCDDCLAYICAKLYRISIHAPTRGATITCIYILIKVLQFQSTHPHGVRRRSLKSIINVLHDFNPRTHTGCDNLAPAVFSHSLIISIHAPTRGATCVPCKPSSASSIFQSTHPHGVRPKRIRKYYPPSRISIHAPTRGATISSTRAR